MYLEILRESMIKLTQAVNKFSKIVRYNINIKINSPQKQEH